MKRLMTRLWNARSLEWLLWGLAGLLGATAAVSLRKVPALYEIPVRAMPSAATAPVFVDADSLRAAASSAVSRDPFRLERRPSAVAYLAGLAQEAPSPPSAPPRPALLLAGIMGGPPWTAVVDGIPGASGSTVVRQGQVVVSLRVRRVTRDLVIIEGADTTWTLRLARPWSGSGTPSAVTP